MARHVHYFRFGEPAECPECVQREDASEEKGRVIAVLLEALEEVYFESNRNCLGPTIRRAVVAAIATAKAANPPVDPPSRTRPSQ